MEIRIKTTNFPLRPAVEDYIHKKIGGLEKFLEFMDVGAEVWVEIGKTTKHHLKGDVYRAEVNLKFANKGLRAEAETGDIYAAIDMAKDALQQQIKKYKERTVGQNRKDARRVKERISA